MYILGISSHYHDSAAALLKNGIVVAAIQEERLTRLKHDKSFPIHAINKCLEISGIKITDIEQVVYYEKPFWKFERILDTITQNVPYSFLQFAKAIPLWVKNRLWISTEIRKKLKYKGRILYSSHHESHGAAAFFTSGFADAAIVTIDGVGEYATTAISLGDNNKIQLLKEQHFPHSLGLLYSAFTQYCGFKVNSGEYKLMGLAAYGKAVFKQKIYDHFITLFPDGSYELNMKYFSYADGLKMINRRFEDVWERPARREEANMDSFYMDIAASIQEVVEEVVISLCHQVKAITKKDNIVFSGGVSLNCKLNQKIVEAGIFNNHFFYPCPGDAGSAVGAAYLGWYGFLGKDNDHPLKHETTYLGNSCSDASNDENIELELKNLGIQYQKLENVLVIANEIAYGKIVGWYNHKMEFGPRALGNRSILADPRKSEMKDILNEKIKLRESFRPFAPAVLDEVANNYFELHACNYNTMMVTAKARHGTYDMIPAVVHADGTARIQTVSHESNKKFYDLIKCFYDLTGCPALINTSFNVRGEPIVESPQDAIRTFLYTDMDMLVFEGEYVIRKDFDLTNLKLVLPERSYAAD